MTFEPKFNNFNEVELGVGAKQPFHNLRPQIFTLTLWLRERWNWNATRSWGPDPRIPKVLLLQEEWRLVCYGVVFVYGVEESIQRWSSMCGHVWAGVTSHHHHALCSVINPKFENCGFFKLLFLKFVQLFWDSHKLMRIVLPPLTFFKKAVGILVEIMINLLWDWLTIAT